MVTDMADVFFILCAALGGGQPASTDWPQFLGPTRDGVYAGDDVVPPAGGAPTGPWKRKVGQGFSAPVVAGGKLVIHHRQGGLEVADCLDAATGAPIWSSSAPTAYRDDFGFDEGPRATPAISGGRVFVHGAEGLLRAIGMDDGKEAWKVDTRAVFKTRKGYFGAACSPLVEGGLVLLNVGGEGSAGIVALDAASGKTAWTATGDGASYSSPVAATVGGKRLAFFFTRAGLTALDPATGAVRFQFPWRARMDASVNAATPIVSGDLVFISASYGTGAALLRLGDAAPQVVWSSDDVLSCHYATGVLRDGKLYGFDGRQEHGARLRAVDLVPGKVLWTRERFGSGTITLAGTHLLVVTEDGELVMAPASPAGFEEAARTRLLPGTVRAHPALAAGRLYIRNEDTLACFDLRKAGK
jgi:outer membrane protein assembly factor BamB